MFYKKEYFYTLFYKYWEVEIKDTDYNTYRWCRNLNWRSIKVKEQLIILNKNKNSLL